MIHLPSHSRVFLALGSTDMRKSINSLSMLVEGALERDPFLRPPVCILQPAPYDAQGPLLGPKRLLSFHEKTGKASLQMAPE